MKKYRFIDGSEIVVNDNTCRGCFLENEENLPIEILPIWHNDFFVIRQDAEIPMPGFYIVSTRQHIHTVGDLSYEKSAELGVIINILRKTMCKVLKIDRIHMILEERIIEPHLHIWMLPLWPNVMKHKNIDPKVWNSNILQYMTSFSYEENKAAIIQYNDKMRAALKDDKILKKIIHNA